MRTLTPSRVASKASISTSSSSSCTWLRSVASPRRGEVAAPAGGEERSRLAGSVVLRPAAVARLSAAGRLDLPPGRPALGAFALDGLFEGRLEELTPELPDLADRARHGPQSDDRGPRRGVDDGHRLRIRHTLGMDPDDTQVDAALLDHERADLGVALEAPCRRDLQPVRRDHV